ncbi:MAG: hypothetical protein R6X35_08910, partial [Candidatus Krumholzibacteriia bacterium]
MGRCGPGRRARGLDVGGRVSGRRRTAVGETLDTSTFHLLGQALATHIRQRGGRRIVIGHDVRTHSPALCQALAMAVSQAGLDVADLGMAPTPVVNFATDLLGADA